MGVQTYGLPDDEEQQRALVNSSQPLATAPETVTGVGQPAMPEVQTSAPPSPGALNQEATPVSTDEQVGGGGAETPQSAPDLMKDRGKPEQYMRKQWASNADQLTESIEGVAKRMEKLRGDRVARAQAQQMTDVMGQQGADPKKAGDAVIKMGEQEVDHLVETGEQKASWGKKIKKRLRNAYNTIPEDEMGLFLMEFGLRAMMAGETMGTMGALGAAGSGALTSLQGRQQAEADRSLAADKYAQEQGLAEYGALTDKQKADTDQMRAETDKGYKDALSKARGQGYNGEKVFLDNTMQTAGFSQQERTAILTGGLSIGEKTDRIIEQLQKKQLSAPYDTDPVTGKEYGEMTVDDMELYAAEILAMQERITKQARGATKADPETAQDFINEAAGK